jgi:mono/diheme cytochrome c family protein
MLFAWHISKKAIWQTNPIEEPTVMKRIRIGAVILAVATVWLPTSGYSQRFDGKKAYSDLCASCHGTSAKGDGPVAPFLNKKPANLTNLAAANGGVFPSERVYEAIDGRRDIGEHGTREMPVWGVASRVSQTLYRARTRAIVEYLVTLQGK